MSIYKMCDIRGRYGDELREEHAEKLGSAVADRLGAAEVIVAGDGRISTPALKGKLIASLVRGGCRVVDLGMGPTPAFYFARQRLGVEAGVMVTASHNPAAENGFKIILGNLPITPQEMGELARLMSRSARARARPGGSVRRLEILPAYIRNARTYAPPAAGMRLVVDCANGMASLVAREIWGAARAEVSYLFDQVDGEFPAHPPNPAITANLESLRKAVLERHADLGVAYDGDADRSAFVDEKGRPLPNDKAIVIYARNALSAKRGVIVYDQKCSRIVPETIQALGGTPVVERSGHTFIKTSFLQHQAEYAGELSGHHFFRELGGDDGIIASLFMAGILEKSRQPLGEIADNIRTYPVTPDIRLPMGEKEIRQVMAELEKALGGEAKVIRTDGLRFEFADSWGIVRPSVTESGVTLRFEGLTEDALVSVLHKFEDAAPELKGLLPFPEVKVATSRETHGSRHRD